jgi:hypothetical protein
LAHQIVRVIFHPAHNAQFCHFYPETPGDLPNFYVHRRTSDAGGDVIDDLNDEDGLLAWLAGKQQP